MGEVGHAGGYIEEEWVRGGVHEEVGEVDVEVLDVAVHEHNAEREGGVPFEGVHTWEDVEMGAGSGDVVEHTVVDGSGNIECFVSQAPNATAVAIKARPVSGVWKPFKLL